MIRSIRRPRALALVALLALLATVTGIVLVTGGSSYAREVDSGSDTTDAAAETGVEARRSPADLAERSARRHRTITVDVAENHRRLHFDEAPVFDDGFPADGKAFLHRRLPVPGGHPPTAGRPSWSSATRASARRRRSARSRAAPANGGTPGGCRPGVLGFTLFEGNENDMPVKKRVTLQLTR